MSVGSLLRELFKKKAEEDPGSYEDLNVEKQDMIRGVVELSETNVKEVMVPRIDTVFLSIEAESSELLEKISDSGHSRFPVYRETIDNVIGILYVKDILRSLTKGGNWNVETLLRKPFFVPESKRIDDLLKELRRRRVHIAVVVDEYGGVSGIVCMEDIIEEIVGDIQDEFDNEREYIMQTGENAWLCDARVNLEDLSDELKLDLPIEDFDTLGGFVFDLFGKIPVKYEKAAYQNLDFIVQEMESHKIITVKIVARREDSV